MSSREDGRRYDPLPGVAPFLPGREPTAVTRQQSGADFLREAAFSGLEPRERSFTGPVRPSWDSLLSPGGPAYDNVTGQPSGVTSEGYVPDTPSFNLMDAIETVRGNARQMVEDIGPQAADTMQQIRKDEIYEGLKEYGDNLTESNVLKGAYQRRMNEFYNEYYAQMDDIKGQYGERLGQLEDELSGYRGGLTDVNAAYASYADDADAILKEAAAVEADALPASEVVNEVDRTYSEFDGMMQDTLAKIDSNGNEALAQAMSSEVTRMQGVMTDGLRSTLATQDELHGLAGAQAQALAHMAWKDDAYQGERARYELELQINQTISAKQDQIAAEQGAMNAAIDKVRASMGEFDMTPDEVWAAAMEDYAGLKGLDPLVAQDMRDMWMKAMENPEARSNYASFKSYMTQQVNFQNLATLGFLDEVGMLQDAFTDAGDTEGLAAIDALYASENMADFVDRFALIARGTGMAISLEAQTDGSMQALEDPLYSSMLDLWSHHDDFQKNYEDYTKAQQTQRTSAGRSAPDNYNNRYQPAYTYRREVVVPDFTRDFLSTFGLSSRAKYVGGYQYLRPPEDVGGGKAPNSDHQSGGALDLYGTSLAQLKEIEAWAAADPRVSYVIYSGDPDHETGAFGGAGEDPNRGHVHVSLLLGYGFEG